MEIKKSGKIKILPLLLSVLVSQTISGIYLDKGNECYNNGKYDEAIVKYKKAIEANENPTLSWFNLGNALYKKGDVRKTISCYETAVLISPEFVRGWINLGVLYYQMMDYGACIAALEQAGSLGNNDVMTLNIMAVAHTELEHYGSAAVYLERVIEIDSTIGEAYLMLYENACEAGDTKEALYWLSKYPEKGSRRYEVLLLSGELLSEMKDSTAALASWRQCTGIDPDRADGWMKLIEQLNNMNATSTALMEAKTALEKNMSNTNIAILAGRIAFEAQYYDQAEYFFRIGWDAGSPDAAIGLGNVLTMYSRYGNVNGVTRIKEIIDGDGKEKEYESDD